MPRRRHEPISFHIASRLRDGRKLAGMSQRALGNALGVSFQQVQKYEKGIDRLSADRLYEISQLLGVAPSYFFEGLKDQPATEIVHRLTADELRLLSEFISKNEGLSLSLPFMKITDPRVRQRIIELVKSLSEG